MLCKNRHGIIFLMLLLFSCSKETDFTISKLDDGYLVSNESDSTFLDSNMNILYSTCSNDANVQYIHYKYSNNCYPSKIEYFNEGNHYDVWIDSKGSPLYIMGRYQYQDIVGFIEYSKDDENREVFNIFSSIFAENIRFDVTSQYLEFYNNEIDSLKSSFYLISDLDSIVNLRFFIRSQFSEDYIYQAFWYSDPISELQPVDKGGRVYLDKFNQKSGSKLFDINNDSISITITTKDSIPTAVQLYALGRNSRKAIYYELFPIVPKYSNKEDILKDKKKYNEIHKRFDPGYLSLCLEKSLGDFSFLRVNKNNTVTVDKKELIALINR